MTDDQQHALQEQRRREADAVEMAGLRADAERARWCEEMKAAVSWSTLTQKWDVFWYQRAYVSMHVADPDRNTAIDAAMKEGK
jgi:hypothetical protein